MDRYTYLLYTIYSLIIITIIIFFISVFNDNDYKLGFYNYVDSYVNKKCYPIRKTPPNVINDLYDIMYNFDKACIDNNVEYFACAGTILGAVRHNKIIPWDDDLDVIVDINERDRLTNIVFPILVFCSEPLLSTFFKKFVNFDPQIHNKSYFFSAFFFIR